jgi:hypothetical protein
MFRFLAQWYAKARYVFNQETEAATNEINVGLASRRAKERRELVSQLRKEADEMDARIKEVEEKLDKGFWECENGHELPDGFAVGSAKPVSDISKAAVPCPQCGATMKLIKCDQMLSSASSSVTRHS